MIAAALTALTALTAAAAVAVFAFADVASFVAVGADGIGADGVGADGIGADSIGVGVDFAAGVDFSVRIEYWKDWWTGDWMHSTDCDS